MNDILLQVNDLKTYFYVNEGVVKALDGVTLNIKKGETLGLVGESGCGKSVTALSILRLIQSPPGKIVNGEIIFNNENLLNKTSKQMRKVRGNDIAMIFQDPMTSLNPVYTIGNQIIESIKLHQKLNNKEARENALKMLKLVNMPDPEKRIDEFPHQLSGGMRQRVMISIALSCSPKLLICDEPTTALDVTIQAQILKLINNLKEKLNMSVMIITHDLGVISEVADRVVVMYAGRIVEISTVEVIFKKPLHPYTEALLKSIPVINDEKKELYTIKGTVPNLRNRPTGCLFYPRCDYAKDICKKTEPELLNTNEIQVRCWKYSDRWGI